MRLHMNVHPQKYFAAFFLKIAVISRVRMFHLKSLHINWQWIIKRDETVPLVVIYILVILSKIIKDKDKDKDTFIGPQEFVVHMTI